MDGDDEINMLCISLYFMKKHIKGKGNTHRLKGKRCLTTGFVYLTPFCISRVQEKQGALDFHPLRISNGTNQSLLFKLRCFNWRKMKVYQFQYITQICHDILHV